MHISRLAPPAIMSIALLSIPSSAATQELRPQFGSRVEVARIQVSVTDADGAFLAGLRPEDFEVRVAGEVRRLIDLLEVTVPESGVAPTPPAEASSGVDTLAVEATITRDESTPERRHFVLFLDLTTMNRVSLRYARRAMTQFVAETVAPQDRVGLAVYTPIGGLRWVAPVTSRHELIAEAIERISVSRAAESVEDPFANVPGGISLDDAVADQLSRDFLSLEAGDVAAALAQVGTDLAPLEARKHLVMVSRGFADSVFTDVGLIREMGQALESLRRNDVVVHSLYPDRMSGPFENRSVLGNRSFLYEISGETGGTSIWFQHNADRGLRELDRATRSYYVLSIPVRPDDLDRLPLDVRMNRPDARVRWAPVEIRTPEAVRRTTEVQRQLLVAAALDPGFDPSLIDFELKLIPLGGVAGDGRFAVMMQMEPAELERLAQERDDGSLQFEILGVAMRPGGQVADIFQSRVSADDSARDAIASGALRYLGVFQAPAGRGLFKLLIREARLDKLSARSAQFEVPRELSEQFWATQPIRVLGPSMADLVRSDRIDDDNYPLAVNGRRLVPDLTPLARSGSSNLLLTNVANLSSHPFTGTYQLLVSAALVVGNDAPVDLEWVRAVGIEPAAEPGMHRVLIELELPRLVPSGEGTLLLTLADAISGARTTVQLEIGVLGE